MVLVVSAVGKKYNKCLSDFLKDEFSNQFDIHILTDRPEDYSNYKTTFYYHNPFSFFDKFLFGIKLLDKIQKPGFIWDADDLVVLERDIKLFNINSNKIQFWEYWNTKGPLSTMDKQNIGYWKFLLDKLKQENIHPDNIMMVLEKKLWFPKQNYSTFINYFESLHLDFINQSIAANSANPALANGEGVALGYALYKSKLNYRNVVETFI